MERRLKMFVIMLYLAVAVFRQSSGARLLRKDISGIGVRNQSTLYPNLHAGLRFSAPKFSVASDETLKLWGDKTKESPKAEKSVLKVAPQGSVKPSGNAMVGMQQLATSTPSPGVGHMQIHTSIAKSPRVSRRLKRRKQKRVSKKRNLQSSPSPGDGH